MTLTFDLPLFVDGVLKVDPANLNGRKGNRISPGLYNPSQKQFKTDQASPPDHPGSTDSHVLCLFIVFIYLACAFRYGSEDLDVMGMSCRKDIWVKRIQVFPVQGGGIPKTPMQESLLKKAGEQAHHFAFEVQEGTL